MQANIIKHLKIQVQISVVPLNYCMHVHVRHKKEIDRQTNTERDRQTDRHIYRERQTDTHIERDRGRDRHTERQTHTHRHTHTDRHTHRDRQTDTHRDQSSAKFRESVQSR
jgi:hypothetical protein